MNSSKAERFVNILNSSVPMNENSYSGYYFAFYGTGGFSTDQSFNPIRLAKSSYASFALYDVTYALQVRYDVRTLNQKLGLIKDACNNQIIQSEYNAGADSFPIDTITISANEFVSGMKAEQVISVGSYESMYNDYLEYTNAYFFGSMTANDYLFSSSSTNDISGGKFDANSLMELIAPLSDSPLTGIITISNINELLRYAVDSDVFNNRIPADSTEQINIDLSSGSAQFTDLSNGSFYDVSDNLTINTEVDIPNNSAFFSFADLSNNIYTTVDNDLLNNTKTTTVVDSSNNVTTITFVDLSNNTSTVTINDLSDNFVTIINTDFTTNNIITTTENITTGDVTTTDASNNRNPFINSLVDISFSPVPGRFGVKHGFIAGDLIFIPAGTTIQLQLMINPMIDASTSNIIDLILSAGLARDFGLATAENGIDLIEPHNLNYMIKTPAIQRILTAPLLIQLDNIS